MPEYRSLPDNALDICGTTNASPRLVAHLVLVHDVACSLVDEIQKAFPQLLLDTKSILFGAATHDIGKVSFPEELSQPGKSHELAGTKLLTEKFGVSENLARFAFSHGNWDSNSEMPLEDLLVALADNCWKGKRLTELESKTVNTISALTNREQWEVFMKIDAILEKLSRDADQRLAWQAQFPTPPPAK